MTDAIVVAEHRNGTLREVTGEAVTAANQLVSGPIALVLIAPDPTDFHDTVSYEGVDTVFELSYDEPFNHDIYRYVTTELVDRLDPSLVLGGNTVNGLDFLPAVAADLTWPLVTDVVGLERAGETLSAVREAYGSKVETTHEAPLPAVISVRPGEWEPASRHGSPERETAPVDIEAAPVRTTVSGIEAVAGGDIDISEADVLVSVGRGIGEEENLALIENLAEALDATISASRPIVDAGWLPKDRQVGQSGKTVTPSVYLAIGISGAVQHVAGMKGAETIVAINEDPDAPIFDIADIGIVDDLFEVVPALTEAVEG